MAYLRRPAIPDLSLTVSDTEAFTNDSNEGKNQSEFFLVIRPHQAVAELMAECPTCGAITSFALELAWQLDVVSCSECNRRMRLDEDDLDGFRERLKEATARVEALKNGPPK